MTRTLPAGDFCPAKAAIHREGPKAQRSFGPRLNRSLVRRLKPWWTLCGPAKQAATRLAAAREIFDRFAGKAIAHNETDISVLFQRKLSEMSVQELQEFGRRYNAATEEPLLIEASEDGGHAETT